MDPLVFKTIRRMAKKGKRVDVIAEVTGLTEEEVMEALAKKKSPPPVAVPEPVEEEAPLDEVEEEETGVAEDSIIEVVD